MGGCLISKKVEAVKGSITSDVIYSWSNSTASYSGDWNTCSSVGKRVKFAEKAGPLTKAQQRKLNELIDEKVAKWESLVIDMGVVGYDVITMKKETRKSTAKFEKVFSVYEPSSGKRVKKFKTQAEACNYAEEKALEAGVTLNVKVEMVETSGKTDVKSFQITRTRKTRKPTGKTIRFQEIHEYRVYAIASC